MKPEAIMQIACAANDGGVVLFALTDRGRVLVNENPFDGINNDRRQEVKTPQIIGGSNQLPHEFQQHPRYDNYCAFAVGDEDYCKRE